MMVVATIFVSCGSDVEPTDPAINFEGADLSEYIAVENVSKPAISAEKYDDFINATVKLKVIKKIEKGISSIVLRSIDLCDENETTLTTLKEPSEYNGSDLNQLIGAEPGKIVACTLREKCYSNSDLVEKTKKIRVNIRNIQ